MKWNILPKIKSHFTYKLDNKAIKNFYYIIKNKSWNKTITDLV